MGLTNIEWTDRTWSPLRARVKPDAAEIAKSKGYISLVRIAAKMAGHVGPHCEHVSHGCDHCYADTNNHRCLPANGTGLPFDRRSRDLVDPFVDEKILLQPLKWRKPQRIFVENQSDLFGEWVTDEQILAVLQTIGKCQRHTFQILTKRPDRAFRLLSARRWRNLGRAPSLGGDYYVSLIPGGHREENDTFLPNVWLGVSVEDQPTADARIPLLLRTPAAVRFVSAEPLLGPVSFIKWLIGKQTHDTGGDGISGVHGDRGVLRRRIREDLEAQAFDSRKSDGDAAILEELRNTEGRRVGVGRLSDCDVFRREEYTPQSLCSSDCLDGEESSRYSERNADKPHRRSSLELSSIESGTCNSVSECNPLDTGSGQDSEGECSPRRGQFLRESYGRRSFEDTSSIGKDVSIEDRSNVQSKTGNDIRNSASQELGSPGLTWLIVGGESGPGARPFRTEWAESVVEQCLAAGVACFVKQLGSHVIQGGERRRKKDRKGGDMHEWPQSIRVRQFPEVRP